MFDVGREVSKELTSIQILVGTGSQLFDYEPIFWFTSFTMKVISGYSVGLSQYFDGVVCYHVFITNQYKVCLTNFPKNLEKKI